MKIDNLANKFLERIAIALEKIAPKDELKNEFNLADKFRKDLVQILYQIKDDKIESI